MKHRAVAAELDNISALMQRNGSGDSRRGSAASPSHTSAAHGSASDMLQAPIPAFSKLSQPITEQQRQQSLRGSGGADAVRKKTFWSHFLAQKRHFCQDRLGTNIRKR